MADMKAKVIVKMTRDAVDMLCKVNTNYIPFVSIEKGRKVIYVKFKKALYGCMQSVILWYSTFKDCLTDLEFEINKYDPCVANAIIEEKQCTICWYVDDSKVPHVSSKVVDGETT